MYGSKTTAACAPAMTILALNVLFSVFLLFFPSPRSLIALNKNNISTFDAMYGKSGFRVFFCILIKY